MSLDSTRRPNRGGPHGDLWPKWMWIAVPVLVVVVVAGLWWAIFSPTEAPGQALTPTPTLRLIPTQPSQVATLSKTLPAPGDMTPTRQLLPPAMTFTPTPLLVMTPTGAASESASVQENLTMGAKVTIGSTGGAGLNMRAGAGTGHARIKTLSEGGIVELIGGPKDANGFTWWQVRDESGTTGWVVSQYLSSK